ncbi:MAG: hypothetical protein Q8Q63_04400 [Phaeovulum sp.]|jgi:hypothetical protein|uniref:hypothetical protein n=1 Tax=Phaeovulum sp. TaxID=2934796 RepID=UPI002731293B|nr:hypothetical protein [Phaeovulum sp.]MDP2062691.1 hypothetical protein [Phaeovulum sp.]MDP3860807.1 hypothetical protein [Phaeovulum sp.]
MSIEQILGRVMRLFGRRAVNLGINKGIEVAARRGKPEAEMTPEDQAQARAARQTAKRARQAVRLARRLGK